MRILARYARSIYCGYTAFVYSNECERDMQKTTSFNSKFTCQVHFIRNVCLKSNADKCATHVKSLAAGRMHLSTVGESGFN